MCHDMPVGVSQESHKDNSYCNNSMLLATGEGVAIVGSFIFFL